VHHFALQSGALYLSFICWSVSCLPFSFGVARYAFRNMLANLPNHQAKSGQVLMADWGLKA